jgi:hypothetical protein
MNGWLSCFDDSITSLVFKRSTKLDHFICKIIFEVYIKWSSLVAIQALFLNGPVLECVFPAKMDHSGKGEVRYSDTDSTGRYKLKNSQHPITYQRTFK